MSVAEAEGEPEAPAIRRIIIGLDAAGPGQAALVVASLLAERLRAELLGLFVEDSNLHRLAALPFAQELQLPTGAGRPLEPQALASELRTLAAGARQAVAAAAGRAQVGWNFQVCRGQLTAAVLAEGGADDLLIFPSGRRLRQRVGQGRRRSPAATRTRAPGERAPIIALFEEGEGGERVLGVAACLAEAHERGLRVLSLAEAPGAARRLQERATSWLAQRGCSSEGVALPGMSAAQVAGTVRAAGGALVVVGSASPLVGAEERGLAALLDELNGPVLVVR